MDEKINSTNYRDYVIKDGRFIGEFEEMYKNIEDPWCIGDATEIQYDLVLYLLDRHTVCLKSGSILDIGCGKGAFTYRIKKARPYCDIMGVDISETAIIKARNLYQSEGIDFRTIDVEKEYRNILRKYDLIILSQIVWYILPHLEEIILYLLKSGLKKNGYLLINQAFYKPDEQTYGKGILSTIEDLIRIIGIDPIELIETNRQMNYNAVALFKV